MNDLNLDENTLGMSREDLLVELSNQIDITRELMLMHREERDCLSKSMAKGKIDGEAWISIVTGADNIIADMANPS